MNKLNEDTDIRSGSLQPCKVRVGSGARQDPCRPAASTKARGIEIRPFYWVCKRALIILTPPYNFAL
jgi:hypothetical protein